MQESRNPSKSRPLSANVKRLMRLARAAPQNENVIKVTRAFTDRDLAYCHKQGNLFMEAASMGVPMERFAPLYMNSQLAGVFDVSFSAANGMENDNLSNLLRIPILLKSPESIVEALFWIEDIVSKAGEGENKSLLLSQAYEAERLMLPPALAELPEEPNRNVDELTYAYSLDGKGELLLTIMSSLAQEESRSISENVTWGQRKRFSDGMVSLPYKHFLGYERGETKDAPPVINPEQAAIVRRIYSMFMAGKTVGGIAKCLTAEGILTPSGKTEWSATTIRSILQNEKYRGSALLQKCFTTDFLTKKRKPNEGEIPQYYIEHSHEAIIRPEEWDAVQEELARRKAIGNAYTGNSVLSAKIKCGDCGSWYGVKVWHSTDKYKAYVWRCNHKYQDGRPPCTTPHLKEEDIKTRFLAAYNSMVSDKEAYLELCRTAREVLTDTSGIDAELEELLREMEVVAGLTKSLIAQNAVDVQDQDEYAARYNAYVARYETAKTRYDALTTRKEERAKKAAAIDRFTAALVERDDPVRVFDDRLWLTVLDYAVVNRNGSITFHFFGGMKIVN